MSTGIVAGVSLLLAPGAWGDFLHFATTNAGAPSPIEVIAVPLPLRVVTSALLITWGARNDHRWTVVIAAGWASLALYESTLITVWLAALVLTSSPDGSRGLAGVSRSGGRSAEPIAATGGAHDAPGRP